MKTRPEAIQQIIDGWNLAMKESDETHQMALRIFNEGGDIERAQFLVTCAIRQALIALSAQLANLGLR